MGYYTNYTISIEPSSEEKLQQIAEYLNQITDYRCFTLSKDKTKIVSETITWYEYDSDIKETSVEFIDTFFTVHGEGENSSDVWNYYCCNGKGYKQEAIITIPDFDSSKLI